MQQPQYYKTVRASDTNIEGSKMFGIFVGEDNKPVLTLYTKMKGGMWDGERNPGRIILEPIPIPDAEVLRMALSDISEMIDTNRQPSLNQIRAIAREALSNTSDGWVRVEEKQPQFGEMVWVYDPETIFPNQYMATWNPCKDDSLPGYFSVGALQGQECWYVTHWRPLPSPPKP